jgi:hypothetical protein
MRKLEKDMQMVLRVLERHHTGTYLSWIGGPVNPEHPCRFRSNPLGPQNDPWNELNFTCQVQNDKMVATVPLESMFVRQLHKYDHDDLEVYRWYRDAWLDPGETLSEQPTIKTLSPAGQRIYLKLTYKISRTENGTKRSCLFMAYDAKEFAELLDCLLDTEIYEDVEYLVEHPEVTRKRPRVSWLVAHPEVDDNRP